MMRYLKIFEDFNNTNDILSNVNDILLELKDFGFFTQVKLINEKILIEISKNKPEDLKVFHQSDVYLTISELNSYLGLGEGLKLESFDIETIEGHKQIENIDLLKRVNTGIISIYICYSLT